MGMNTFRKVVHALYPIFNISPDFDFGHAHNEFLQVGLDLGFPGMIAFISIYIISFLMLIQIWKPLSLVEKESRCQELYDPDLIRALVIGLGCGLFAHLLFGMLDAISLGAKPGIFFWMLLGLITGLYKNVVEYDK
jgi:O-antigen ligase